MSPDKEAFNVAQDPDDGRICDALAREIGAGLRGADGRIWHGHPVWSLGDHPIVGHCKLKDGVRAAEARFTAPGQVDRAALRRRLEKGGA